jgi:hypothetical protein
MVSRQTKCQGTSSRDKTNKHQNQCWYILAQCQQNFAGAGCLLAQLLPPAPAKFKMCQQNLRCAMKAKEIEAFLCSVKV